MASTRTYTLQSDGTYIDGDGSVLVIIDSTHCTIDDVPFNLTVSSHDPNLYAIENRDYRGLLMLENGAKFFNLENKHDNYSDKQQGVCDSLTQRLSVLKGELWYNVHYGMPLLDKVKSKTIIDAHVISTITRHPDVNRIDNFESKLEKHSYTAKLQILTIYGEVSLEI